MSQIVLGYTVLRAPFAGVIQVRQAELGEIMVPGTPVVTLADLDHVWLRAYINETDIGKVRYGQSATVTTDTYPGKNYTGRVSFISANAEFTPKSVETHAERVTLVYRIRIDIDNPIARTGSRHAGRRDAASASAGWIMNAPGSCVIEADGLTKHFAAVAAVDGLTFTVDRGEIFGLVGPDGAGKTTTMRMLAGVMRPDGGSIVIDGVDVVADPEEGKPHISYMPQRFGLYEDLTVDENIRFYADLFEVPARLRAKSARSDCWPPPE